MSDRKKNNKPSKTATWIYGAVPAGTSLKEVERRERLPKVRIVEAGDLGAIVGSAPKDTARATRDRALAHARVLEAAVVDAPVVPFRFGTEVQGDDDVVVSELLEPYHDELARRLSMVEDVVQMTLKANYDEQEVLRQLIESDPELANAQRQTRSASKEAAQSARAQFGELLYKALGQWRARDSEVIVERLKPVSVAFVPGEIESDFMVLNVPFLVKRDQIDEFEQAVADVADEFQGLMYFTLLGPMPAYNFIDGG